MSNPDRIPRPKHLFPEAAAWLIQAERGLLRMRWALRDDHDWFPAWSTGSIAGVCGIMLAVLLFFMGEPKLVAAPTVSVESQSVLTTVPEPEPTLSPSADLVFPQILSSGGSDLSESEIFRTRLQSRWDQREIAKITSQPKRIKENLVNDEWLKTVPSPQPFNRFQSYLPLGATVPIPPSYISSTVFRTTFDGVQPTRSQGILIEKQTPPSTSVGQPFTYTIHITNRTNDPIDQVVVRERLSAIHRVSKVDPPAAVQGDELVWSLDKLPARGRRTLQVTLIPESQAPIKTDTTLQNKSRVGGIATVSPPPVVEPEPELIPVEPEPPVVPVFEERKPKPAPDPAPVSTLPKPFPDLKLEVTPVRAVKKGETISLTFTVTNVGTAAATDIALYLNLSGEMKHKFGDRVKHTISRLDPGQSHEALFQATARKPGNGRLSASLTMQGTEEESEELTIRIETSPQGISRRSQKTSSATERPVEINLSSTQWKRFTE